MSEPVAWLYAPASRPELFAKAARAADAVVVDLEDAVEPRLRPAARGNLAALRELTVDVPIVVRVNPVDSPDFAADLAAVTPLVAEGIVTGIRIPKVESPDELGRAADAVADWAIERPLICQIESARGVQAAAEIARSPRVGSIMLGEADLRADLRLPRGRASERGLLLARLQLVLASRAAGLPGPVASVFTQLDDPEGLAASSRELHELGFSGRSCLHPKQVPTVREQFGPSQEDLAWAQDVIARATASAAEGTAALTLDDGSFVDPAIVRQARLLLRTDGTASTHDGEDV